MRRTQAQQLPNDFAVTALSAMTCRVCGATGCAVIALGVNGNGAIERRYCDIPCARREGWPWLLSERRQGELRV